MVGTIANVLSAALLFVGIHLLSSTSLRRLAVNAMGEKAYQGLFSILVALSLVWLVWAHGAAPYEELWPVTTWARHLPSAVMPFAFVLAVLGLATPNPTMAGLESRVESSDPAPGIIKITRHPLLWGIALWAGAHLPANGDVASIVLFGSLGFLALVGMRLIDRKREDKLGPAWGPFALTTSIVPFVAAIQGRTKIAWGEIGWWKVALGLALYVAFLYGHGFVIGIPVMPA